MCERIEQGFARSHGGRARFFSDACLQGEPASCAAEQARGLANCLANRLANRLGRGRALSHRDILSCFCARNPQGCARST